MCIFYLPKNNWNFWSLFCRIASYATGALASSSTLTSQSTIPDAVSTADTHAPESPLHEPRVCHDGACRNGGTCHQLQLPGGAVPSCHCPLHFTGIFCETGEPEGFLFFVFFSVLCLFFSWEFAFCFFSLKTPVLCNIRTQAVLYYAVTSTADLSRSPQQIALANIYIYAEAIWLIGCTGTLSDVNYAGCGINEMRQAKPSPCANDHF